MMIFICHDEENNDHLLFMSREHEALNNFQ